MSSHDQDLGLSERARATLLAMGWTRAGCSADGYIDELTENGFSLNENAQKILRAFGGFTLSNLEGGVGWFSFRITEARHTFKADHIPVLDALVERGTPCPVGAGAGYIMFACPSGSVALLHEQWFYLLVADSFADMMEAILFNDRSRCLEVANVEICRPDW